MLIIHLGKADSTVICIPLYAGYNVQVQEIILTSSFKYWLIGLTYICMSIKHCMGLIE